MTRVLVVEDNDEYRGHLCEYLKRKDYQVVEACSEREARDALQREAQTIGVAVIDLKLESENSGIDLLRTVSDMYSHIVSIVLTGLGEANLRASMEAGAFSFLEKQRRDPEEILEVVQRACLRHVQKRQSGTDLMRELSKIRALLGDATAVIERVVAES